MAKETGKRFNIPIPLFDTQAYRIFESIIVNEYRKITFDVTNPKMADKRKFPKYSTFGSKWVTMNVRKQHKKNAPKEGYSYEQAKKGNMLQRQDSSYSNSRAPVVSGDLMRDTNSTFSVKDESVYIGWSAHANKLDWLRNNDRILTSRQHPINPNVIKKVMPSFNKELKRRMPKGVNTITIGKKK